MPELRELRCLNWAARGLRIDTGGTIPDTERAMLKPETSACLEASIEVGDVIADKYVIRSVLGQGGMGVVCEATHRQLGERVAIKLLTAGGERAPAARARFMREARVTAKLRGEHTARVSDFGVLADGTPYMVMEYLEGVDLRRLLRDETNLSVDVAVHYTVQTCIGLAEAHSMGIVHRDLKPSNLFVTERPDGSDLVKIVDFGISKSFCMAGTDDNITVSGTILGSPRYMAPEQLEDSINVDARADIWSLGAVLYEMLAGHPPYTASSPAALCHVVLGGEPPLPLAGRVRGVTPELEAVVFACLDRNLETRIENVGVLARALNAATALDGLDAAASRIEGILQRAMALGVTDTQTSSRVHAVGRRRGTSSSVSQVGPVAHSLRPKGRRSMLWVAVPAAALVAIALLAVGLVRRNVVTRGSAPTPFVEPSGAGARPPPNNDRPDPSTPIVPIDSSNDGGLAASGDAQPAEPVASAAPTALAPTATRARPPKVPFTGAAQPAPVPTPSKTRDPFDDRF